MEGKVGSEAKPGPWPEWACFQEQGLGRVVQVRERNTAAFLLCSLPGMRTLDFPIFSFDYSWTVGSFDTESVWKNWIKVPRGVLPVPV